MAKATKYPTVSRDPEVQRRYVRLRRRGESHSIAEMLATRKTPAAKTEATFSAGRGGEYGETDPVIIEKLRKNGAPRNGVYHGTLARFQGDPLAVVSSQQEYDLRNEQFKREERASGKYKPIDVAPDILEREYRKAVAEDPSKGATKKRREETKAALKHKISGGRAK